MVGCGEHGGGDGPLYTLDLLWDYNALNGFVVLSLRKLKDLNNVVSQLNKLTNVIYLRVFNLVVKGIGERQCFFCSIVRSRTAL